MMAPPFAPEFFQLYVPPAKQASFGYDDFVAFLRSVVVTKEVFGDKANAVAEKIVAFYLRRNTSENANNVFYLRRYTQVAQCLCPPPANPFPNPIFSYARMYNSTFPYCARRR